MRSPLVIPSRRASISTMIIANINASGNTLLAKKFAELL